MSFTRIRKTVLDNLVTEIKALKHYDGTSSVFNDVQRIYLDFPELLPSAQIVPIGLNIDSEMIDFDNRELKFALIVYENIEADATQATIDLKVDRLCDIEDVIARYIEQVPNNVGIVSGVRIYKTTVSNGRWTFEQGNNGMMLYLVIEFSCFTQLTVKDM